MKVNENNDLWRKPVVILPFRQAFPELGTNSQYSEKKVIISEDREWQVMVNTNPRWFCQ